MPLLPGHTKPALPPRRRKPKSLQREAPLALCPGRGRKQSARQCNQHTGVSDMQRPTCGLGLPRPGGPPAYLDRHCLRMEKRVLIICGRWEGWRGKVREVFRDVHPRNTNILSTVGCDVRGKGSIWVGSLPLHLSCPSSAVQRGLGTTVADRRLLLVAGATLPPTPGSPTPAWHGADTIGGL